ncbi:MAG: glycoside hydrolase family 15 protein, partial [Sphingomonas sp.]
MTVDMDLWPIGNCQVSALIDRDGRFVWGCVPRVDGDPAFTALLDSHADAEPETGYWAIEMEGATRTTQWYVRNTPILVTRHEDDGGNAVEITSFCPRFDRNGRPYRPTAFARIVRPMSGSPRIRTRLRVATDWGAPTDITTGSNHIRYLMRDMTLRLTTLASIDRLRGETWFRLTSPLY